MLSIGALTVVGGGAVAYLAGPGLLLVGAVEAVNMGGAVAAGVAGSAGAGYAANRYFTEAIADRNYVQVSAANRLISKVVQSRRRPLLGPSPG